MSKTVGIKVISKACGILPSTIRTWENRYQAFRPIRDEQGVRQYSEDDVMRAKKISQLIDQGHLISKLAHLNLEELSGLSQVVSDQAKQIDNKNSHAVSLKNLFRYLSAYEIDHVYEEMKHLRITMGARDFIFQAILPVMQNIGTLVAKGKYSVTQEHIVSTIVRDQIGQIDLPNLSEKSDKIMLATPDGNMHELSILIADILCKVNRVATSYLGASHPAFCLGEAISALKSNTLVMGVVSSDKWEYELQMIPYLKSLDKHLNHSIKVFLGGGWPLEFPEFKNIEQVTIMETFEDFDHALKTYKV